MLYQPAQAVTASTEFKVRIRVRDRVRVRVRVGVRRSQGWS